MGHFNNTPLRYFTPPFNIYPGLAPFTVLFGFAASGHFGDHDTHLRDVLADQEHKIQFRIIPTTDDHVVVYTRGFVKNGNHDYERVTPPMDFFSALQIISVLHDENAPLQKLYGRGPRHEHHPINLSMLRQYNELGVTPGIVTTRAILPPHTIRAADNPDFLKQTADYMAGFRDNRDDVLKHLRHSDQNGNPAFLFGDNKPMATSFFAMHKKHGGYGLFALSPIGQKRLGHTDDFQTACRTLGLLEHAYIMPNILHATSNDLPVMHYAQWAHDAVLHDIARISQKQPKAA